MPLAAADIDSTDFPIDLTAFKPVPLDPKIAELTDEQHAQLEANVQLCRDAIVFFTATGAAKGLGGHTGGPFDIVPEVLIADGFMRGGDGVYPAYFDEAGHRVAIQYLMSVLNGHMPAEKLVHYREADSDLPGHPELGLTPGVTFSSGRLGHMWPYVNGVALAHPDQAVFCFGSDGSEQEGNDAEAARLAVAQQINIKIVVDDNDVTIAGHPSQYLPGYHVVNTLAGHGLKVLHGEGEDLRDLYRRMAEAVNTPGPIAVINHRTMAIGIPDIEGTPEGHDVVPVKDAIAYLKPRGHDEAIAFLESLGKGKDPFTYRGSSDERDSNRNTFGKAIGEIIAAMDPAERKKKVVCIDSDLEGSTGLVHIRKAAPDIYIKSGIMERGNFSAAAGFGMKKGRQGITGTFSAFLEMCISEITMARLNSSNVLCHFSHAGIDDMADNTCHFGINNMFAANGLEEWDQTRLYFPADSHQMTAVCKRIFNDPGLRFVFSTRSKTPFILSDSGGEMYGGDYAFEPDKDEIVREAKDGAGYIVSFGSALYRALDAVEQLREKGVGVGLVNKPTLNTIDEDVIAKVGKSPFVLVVEEFNKATGVGSKYGSWLLERGLTPRFAHLGTTKEGCGGLWQQFPHQGLDPASIIKAVEALT